MFYLPTSIILFGYSITTLIYILINWKDKVKKGLIVNELAIALLFGLAGMLFPYMFIFHSASIPLDTLNFLWLLTSITFLIEMGILFIILVYNTIISKRNPQIMAEREYGRYCEEFNQNWNDDLKSERGRKMLHLFTSCVIFICWSLGTILDAFGILDKISLDNYSFSYLLIIIIGFGFIFMFQIADLARLNKFYMLPNWARKWYLSMRKEEQETFLAATPLVLSFVPFIFAPFPIFGAVSLIATGADAMACIIGKKYGKHSLRKNSKKTIEGFVAGGISTFLIVFIIFNIYHIWMPINQIKIIMMAFIATSIFLIVDMYAKFISDNILNPILTGLGMWLIYLL
ncbi:MAG: hypothetical protein ACFFEO_04195 [Candidatus Thorarchaeota archaeon]